MIKYLLTPVLFFFFSNTLIGQTTYYVSSSGNNTNNGSLAAPFKTIQYAVNKVVAGDIIYVMTGTYNEKVAFSKSGSSGNYITLSALSGHTPVVDGNTATVLSPSGREGLISIIDQSFIKIIGFEIRDFSGSGGNTPVGIYIEGQAHNIEIRNNKVHDINGTGGAHGIATFGVSSADAAHDLIFDGNEVYNCHLYWSEAFVINGNVRNFQVINNSVHDCDNIGYDFIGYEGECSSCTGATGTNVDRARDGYVGYNIAYNIDTKDNLAYGGERSAAGFYVDGGDNIIFEGNISHDCNLGLELASEHYGKATSNITVRNNIFYKNHVLGISTGGYSSGTGAGGGQATNCVITNNTLYNNNNSTRSEDQWGAEILLQNRNINNTYQNNIVIANNYLRVDIGSLNSGIVWHNNLFNGSNGADVPAGGNSIFGNPGFENPASANFNLTSTSDAIDKGYASSATVIGTLDFNKSIRVGGSAVDIGAIEYNVVLGLNLDHLIPFSGTNSASNHSAFSLYPNPSEDKINISIDKGEQILAYRIVDVSGKTWKSGTEHRSTMIETLQLTVQDLAPQLYLLVLQLNNKVITGSFIKK
jgi:hypothetical protein